MLGVLVNTAVVIVGSLIGIVFKKGIPDRLTDGIMTALGLCVIYIGVSGTLEGEHTLAIILSMALGALLGTLLDIDSALNRFGGFIEQKFNKRGTEQHIGAAMISATLLYCVGAMTVVGALRAGMGDNTMLFTKSILDLVSSIVLTVSLGYGVIFSAIPVFILEGTLVLFSSVLYPLLSTSCISDLTCVGSLMIIAIGLNVTKATDIKVANLLPALILSPFITYAYKFISSLFS